MVTVQNVILAMPQLTAQGADKLRFLHQGNGRMDHAGAERARPLVHRSRLLEDAIKGPIDFYSLFTRMPEHPEEPIFHCAAVEIFDNVEDSQHGLEKRM